MRKQIIYNIQIITIIVGRILRVLHLGATAKADASNILRDILR